MTNWLERSRAVRRLPEPVTIATIATIAPEAPSIGEPAEAAAIIQEGAGLPAEWANAFARLLCSEPPSELPTEAWQAVLDGVGRFLDAWGVKAEALGWRARDLFNPGSLRGAAFFLAGAEVLALTAAEIVIRRNGITGRLRRGPDGTAPTWEALP